MHEEDALVKERAERKVSAIRRDEREHVDGHRFPEVRPLSERFAGVAGLAMPRRRGVVATRCEETAQPAMRRREGGIAGKCGSIQASISKRSGFVIERQQICEVDQRSGMVAVNRDRAFEHRACIEPPSAPCQHDAQRYERVDVLRCGREHGGEGW